MKVYKMKTFLLSSLILLAIPSYAAKDNEASKPSQEQKDEHEEENELPAGITFFKDETGEFSLRPNVLKNFGIAFTPIIKDKSGFKVPSESIVSSLKVTSVFIFYNNMFRNLKVKVVDTAQSVTYISSTENLTDLKVVSKGSNFLKTILLSLEEGPSEGH